MNTSTDTPEPALSFSVSYSLREYLSIVQDHLPTAVQAEQLRRGKPPGRLPALARPVVALVASCLFFYKKRRMPVCHFRIDGQAIQRETADGTLTIPWSEVLAVHAYTQGYLVEKAKGAVPLPYRCFGSAERQRFETWWRSREG